MEGKSAPIDLGEMLELLTLSEKSAKDGREGMCVKRQLDAHLKSISGGLVIAGAPVLAQMQNGDARLAASVQGQTPQEQGLRQEIERISILVNASVGNLVNCAMMLKKKLEAAGAGG